MSSPTSVEASPSGANVPSGISQPASTATNRKVSIFSTLFGDCMCDANHALKSFKSARHSTPSDADVTQPHSLYTELDGVECINLGSVEAEQTPAQRVRETINQLSTSDPTRLISIGHLEEGTYDGHEDDRLHVNHPHTHKIGFADTNAEEGAAHLSQTAIRVKTKMVPLELYESSYPGDLDRSLNRRERAAVRHIRAGEYDKAIGQLEEVVRDQKRHMAKGDNKYLLGITLHNLGVVRLLEGGNDQMAIELFREAADANLIKRLGRSIPSWPNRLMRLASNTLPKTNRVRPWRYSRKPSASGCRPLDPIIPRWRWSTTTLDASTFK